jgi:hypothetical protein
MRERDLAFEALCEVCSMDWAHLTANERGRTNAALKQLRDLETEASDEMLAQMIRGHAAAYKVAYVDIPLTPTALASNWSLVIPLAKEKAALRVQQNAPASSRGCPECGGDKWVDAGLDSRGFPVSRPCSTCQSVPRGPARHDERPVDRAVPVRSARPRPDLSLGTLTLTCVLCGHEIFEHEFRTMYGQWVSWHPEKGRAEGGPRDKGKAAVKTKARAHGHCVDALHAGRLNQESLFVGEQQAL